MGVAIPRTQAVSGLRRLKPLPNIFSANQPPTSQSTTIASMLKAQNTTAFPAPVRIRAAVVGAVASSPRIATVSSDVAGR